MDIRKDVRKTYSKIAKKQTTCCNSESCCENKKDVVVKESDLGLSCGEPVMFSKIKEGMTVVDLGCGAGKDVFIAAKIVGDSGKVIGIDMTDDMIKLARRNAKKFKDITNLDNVIFKKGYIEDIPLENNIADLVISNCVINLSPQKEKVFKEIYRILKDKGEMVISDIVLTKDLPIEIKNNRTLYSACLSGAILKKEYISFIKKACFKNIKILSSKKYKIDSSSFCKPDGYDIFDLTEYALSITVSAEKW